MLAREPVRKLVDICSLWTPYFYVIELIIGVSPMFCFFFYVPFWNIFIHCGGHTFSQAMQKIQSFSLAALLHKLLSYLSGLVDQATFS